ncbi:hypothetical protein C1878_13965 [Gordonibacter sp. 28C]|uniref:nucleotide kinase domain-containing protein n=1 Tax=Gordonibacter sp. 28C TaxID=2078569 RepID=UPI000DF76363|nr:nucleotide kinase domain-containing protein [Gordonibacter sp. 28C]RDB60552.1 hypothetical protein C1878_13965 [Gordonibacter sp. 28C]
MKPKPRTEVYSYYWKFAHERMQIFYNRMNGDKFPWTDDPILQQYKFCNAYRVCDRVSQYLVRNICYRENIDSEKDLLFQIVAFRIFSRIETWQELIVLLGHQPTLDDLKNDLFESALIQIRNTYGKLYTGAFILCANDAYGRRAKHLNHVSLLKDMFFNNNLYDRIKEARSLESIYRIIHEFPLMGDFMSYQIAIDINYSELVNFSENDFTQAGPGAQRGIAKVFADTRGMTATEVIMWMTEHQKEEFNRLGYPFEGLFGRPLHAIDCQNLFCEVDKYCRVAFPEVVSNRKRIKTKFRETSEPIDFFFPPKWELPIMQHGQTSIGSTHTV